MALGLTRDSYAQLSSLVDNEEGRLSSNRTSKNKLNEPSARVGDSTVVSLKKDNQEPLQKDRESSFSSASTTSQAKDEPSASSYGDYSGFAWDYAEYSYDGYNTDPYAPTLLGHERGKKSLFCCLLPSWGAKKGNDQSSKSTDENEDDSIPSAPSADSSVDGVAAVPNGVLCTEQAIVDHTTRSVPKSKRDDDEVSSTGSEILGDKLTERERSAVLARLGLSQPDTPLMTDPPTPTGKGLLDQLPDSDEKPLLKGILKRGTTKSSSRSSSDTHNKSSAASPGERRSLFPVYHEEEKKESDPRRLQFAPMARVVTVKSRRSMTYAEKGSIWWQKSDYDDFKKTGRLVAKAMLQGGSEVWLMTNKSWKSPGTKSTVLNDSSPTKEEDLDNKWWHKFGHSRRGLEHIASMEEGKQRQMNVRVAVKAVLDDQRKQRMFGKHDPEKTRKVYNQYSSWARELAIAAAASDEEAVSSNFSEQRHSREFYLRKHRGSRGGTAPRHFPDFMKPITDPYLTSPHALDANTRSQLRMNRKNKVAPITEAIHDPVPHSGKSIAQQAAGFGTADENVSMAAVLSGMGTVGTTPTRTSVASH